MFKGNFYHNLVLIVICFPLIAAGFDCKKSKTTAEYKICSTPQLKKADRQMSNAYSKLRDKLPKSDAELLKQDQQNWLRERDYELFNCTESNCKLHFYAIRTKQLEAPISQASFDCNKIATEIETRICNSRLLRHADGRMTELYNQYEDKLLRQDQRNWLKLRNEELRQPYCDINCIWQLYKDRIEFLLRYPHISVPEPQ